MLAFKFSSLSAASLAAFILASARLTIPTGAQFAAPAPLRTTLIAAGWETTCAVLENGKLKCWGQGYYGVLGQDNSAEIGNDNGEMGNTLQYTYVGANRTISAMSLNVYQTCAVFADGGLRCWGGNTDGLLGQGSGVATIGNHPGDMEALSDISLGNRLAVGVAAGQSHTCALLTGVLENFAYRDARPYCTFWKSARILGTLPFP